MRFPLFFSTLFLAPLLLAAEAPLELNFNNGLDGAVSTVGDPGQVQVLAAADIPGGAFDAGAKEVLALEKGAHHELLPRSTWALEPQTSGVLRFKAYTPVAEQFNTPLLNIFLCQDNLQSIGPSIYFSLRNIHVQDGDAWRVYEGQWNTEAVNEVAIEFFEDQTYRVLVNGISIADEATRFRYRVPEVQMINRVQFAVASSSVFASRVYVDDVTLAPLDSQ